MRSLVLIPLHNEENTIGPVLRELRRHYTGDVVVIDDGSSDSSLDRTEEWLSPSLRILRHPHQRGYGAALMTGFAYARQERYDIAVTMDCDCQHEPEQVPEFLRNTGDWDVLSGSRYLPESPSCGEPPPPGREQVNKLITARINEITRFGITDAFCGFKAYKVPALARMMLDEAGYAFPLQFWIQAWCSRLRIREIPVTRIYLGVKRSFGPALDDQAKRLAYYHSTIVRELARCEDRAAT